LFIFIFKINKWDSYNKDIFSMAMSSLVTSLGH